MRTLRLFATFYGYFFLSALVLTAGCLAPFWRFGPETLGTICWFKLFTLGVTALFITVYKRKEFFYFRNLGLPPVILWTVTMAFDIVLFSVSACVIYYFKWRTP